MTEYYNKKFNEGLEFQDYITQYLYKKGIPIISFSSSKYQYKFGENIFGIEIKYDQKFRQTGNLYIEIAEKTNKENIEYISSGIFRNDNTWLYLIGDEMKIFILSKKQLKILYEKKKYKEVITPTSKGFLLPVNDAEKFYNLF